MAKRDAVVPIEYGNGKTFWHKIGTAFENDKGQITLFLNSLPLPDAEGKTKIMLFEQQEKGGGRQQQSWDSGMPDDEIPF